MTSTNDVIRLADCHEAALAGGKAINLAAMIGAGLPVPDGFVVSTHAYRQAGGKEIPPELARVICAAYHEMGSPTVAVRSSATAEDMAQASMAGQYETYLNIKDDAALLEAVAKCWASMDAPRILSYLKQHGIDRSQVAMAVVVQRLILADVAGVLFTENPRLGSGGEMLIEASWGLGEAVVSGLVQPDTLILDRATGAVKQATIGNKQVWVPPNGHGEQPVPADKRTQPSLTSRQVRELWRMGLRIMEYYGKPQDVEWAIHDGKVYLLQSRSITTLEDAEAYGHFLTEVRGHVTQATQQGRGDWVRHNLSETLPHPTPLTWSVIRRFMSGDGGFGAMYRQVGFEPSPVVCREGMLDLIGGRVYMDLSRAGGMFFEGFPFVYDLELLQSNPDASQGPPTVPSGSFMQQWQIGRKLLKVNRSIEQLADGLDRQLTEQMIPEFMQWVKLEKSRDLKQLTTENWLQTWQDRLKRVMDQFAPQSLLPSLVAAMAMAHLRQFAQENLWQHDPDHLINVLSGGSPADLTVQSTAGLWEVAQDRKSLERWLEQFGHRTTEEFDLASPRWRQRPDAVQTLAGHLRGAPNPLELHRKRHDQAIELTENLKKNLSAGAAREFKQHLDLLWRYLPWRENAKHYLMMGYDLLRDMALEAGRRLDLDLPEDVFLLSEGELTDCLRGGFAPLHLIEQRRMIRSAQAKLSLPFMLKESELMNLGQPQKLHESGSIPAFSISSGHARGPARIVLNPQSAGDLGSGYVLVCPSTDPGWTPLLIKASALVLERGGTLSHGAVIAREMGVPAVVLDGATQMLKEGQILEVDGHHGSLRPVQADETGTAERGPTPDGRLTHEMIPPPPGPQCRRAAMIRNISLAIWAVYFLLVWLLPAKYLYDPSINLLDKSLWPLAVQWGRPAIVILIAAVMGALTLIGHRLLTDNPRLLEAKKRAGNLRKSAQKLPADAPQRKPWLAMASQVQGRIMGASMVPLAVVLGPMVMSFMWLTDRIDPASWNSPPGAVVYVTATVDGDYLNPIELQADSPVLLDSGSPSRQTCPPIRPTLQKLLAQRQAPSTGLSTQPWEIHEASNYFREIMLNDLQRFLKGPMPQEQLTWMLHTPAQMAGRFPVTLSGEKISPIQVNLVLGDQFPPPSREIVDAGKPPVQCVRPQSVADKPHPISLVKVIYQQKHIEGEGIFWNPLKFWKPSFDAGWLSLYLLVYLPLFFGLKAVLKLP